MLITFIIRMGDNGQAGCQQFRSGGGDGKGFIAVFDTKANVMEKAFHFLVFYFCLRNGRFERNVPHNRRFYGNDFAFFV